LIVPEREGRLIVFENDPDVTDAVVALDLRHQVQGNGDGGLLGLVFHPDFGKTGARHEKSIFLNYLYIEQPRSDAHDEPNIDTYARLARFDYDIETHQLVPESEELLIDQLDENVWHQGGSMFFHPRDGFLYFAVGDEGGSYCRLENCQRIDKDLFSGVLRIDVDQRGGDISHPIDRQPKSGVTGGYYIPNDNPFVGNPGILEEFYALGLRSPHRMTYDSIDDLSWIGEVGQSTHEELNVLRRGANYQWAFFEGTSETETEMPEPIWGDETAPVLEFLREEARSIIGGYVYRGGRFPDLYGQYIYADYIYGDVYALTYEKKQGETPPGENLVDVLRNDKLLTSEYKELTNGITSFGHDENGELFITTLGENSQILTLETEGAQSKPNVPKRLSDTHLILADSFKPGAALSAGKEFLPYEVNSPLYSDGADKTRFVAVPRNSRVKFSESGSWQFPPGTVFLKHFQIALDASRPDEKTRLETRVLVVQEKTEGVYGMTYRWNAAQTNANLVETRTTWNLLRKDAEGTEFTQSYVLPGRSDCLTCHTRAAGYVLGVRTAQLNGEATYEPACEENQLLAWDRVDLFDKSALAEGQTVDQLPRLVSLQDDSASLEERVRSYWDSNCSMCHRPDHLIRALWDARIETPLQDQGVVQVVPFGGAGDPNDLLVFPGRPDDSLIYKRTATTDDSLIMPPLGRRTEDQTFTDVLRRYIEELD
jgi:uncharacterized repeat protein (TIGR03806 family)